METDCRAEVEEFREWAEPQGKSGEWECGDSPLFYDVVDVRAIDSYTILLKESLTDMAAPASSDDNFVRTWLCPTWGMWHLAHYDQPRDSYLNVAISL